MVIQRIHWQVCIRYVSQRWGPRHRWVHHTWRLWVRKGCSNRYLSVMRWWTFSSFDRTLAHIPIDFSSFDRTLAHIPIEFEIGNQNTTEALSDVGVQKSRSNLPQDGFLHVFSTTPYLGLDLSGSRVWCIWTVWVFKGLGARHNERTQQKTHSCCGLAHCVIGVVLPSYWKTISKGGKGSLTIC